MAKPSRICTSGEFVKGGGVGEGVSSSPYPIASSSVLPGEHSGDSSPEKRDPGKKQVWSEIRKALF